MSVAYTAIHEDFDSFAFLLHPLLTPQTVPCILALALIKFSLPGWLSSALSMIAVGSGKYFRNHQEDLMRDTRRGKSHVCLRYSERQIFQEIVQAFEDGWALCDAHKF